jgi:hypothetical protein
VFLAFNAETVYQTEEGKDDYVQCNKVKSAQKKEADVLAKVVVIFIQNNVAQAAELDHMRVGRVGVFVV